MKEKIPKFNPGYEYLENPAILELQKLFDEIVAGDKDTQLNKIPILQERWQKLLEEYAKMAKIDDSNLRQLIKFFRFNMRILDLGGMLLGRSKIGIMMSEENEKLITKHDNLIKEVEK